MLLSDLSTAQEGRAAHGGVPHLRFFLSEVDHKTEICRDVKVSGFYRSWYDVKGPVGPQCKLVVKATNMLS